MEGKIRSWFKVRFITGFFVIVPVVLTAWVLWVFYREIDGFLSPVYEQIVGRHVPGLRFLAAVVIIFLIGVIATNVVGRRVLRDSRAFRRRGLALAYHATVAARVAKPILLVDDDADSARHWPSTLRPRATSSYSA